MSAAKTVFMFSGQGSQYYQMGKPLFDGDDIFREHMLHLDTLVQKLSGKRVREAIHAGSKADAFDRTQLTHSAIIGAASDRCRHRTRPHARRDRSVLSRK